MRRSSAGHAKTDPVAQLEEMILTEGDLKAAHGNRDVPVWGPVLRQVEKDEDLGLGRTRRLVEFLTTLQRR